MRTASVAVCIAAGLASSAAASTIQLRYNSLVHGTENTHTVTIHANSNILPGSRTSLTVYAGPLNHQTGAATGSLSAFGGGMITTFCTELSQTVKSSWNTFEATALENAPRPATGTLNGMGAVKADAIRLLWAGVGSAKFTDALIGAAFQIAIWEIIYDGPENFNLANGDVRFSNAKIDGSSSTALTKAQELFETHVWDNGGLRNGTLQTGLIALGSDHGQDQLIVIPLPAQGALALAGLLGIGAIRRRRV